MACLWKSLAYGTKRDELNVHKSTSTFSEKWEREGYSDWRKRFPVRKLTSWVGMSCEGRWDRLAGTAEECLHPQGSRMEKEAARRRRQLQFLGERRLGVVWWLQRNERSG